MNKKSFALVSGIVLAAASFAIPISANSVDIHQVASQDTPQLLAQGRGRGRDRDRDRDGDRDGGRGRDRGTQNPSPCPTNSCPGIS